MPNFGNILTIYNKFAWKPQNIRLGLGMYGFNPFENMNIAYNI